MSTISGGQSAMEQARYWMWMKKKNMMKPCIQESMNESWEEQAFAEDAAGALGGCIWPPRSYSCNFCRREFRSAQALGGHMNVHRRDRARLKQSLSPQTTEVVHNDQNNHDQNPCKSLGPQYPSQVNNYNHDPNCTSSTPCFVAPSSGAISPSRVSANSSTQENLSDHTFVSLNSSSSNIVQLEKYHKGSHANSSPPSGSDSVVALINPLTMSDYSRTEAAKSLRIEESVICMQVQNDYIETDLSLGLNLVVSRNQRTRSHNQEEVISTSKRHKTDVVSSLPFFLKLHLNDPYRVRSDVHGLETTSIDELDLELRLGDPPKAKKLGCNPKGLN